MAFDKTNIELNFEMCSSCSSFKFIVTKDIFLNAVGEYGITSATLKLNDISIDIYTSLVSASNAGTISATNGSDIIIGSGTTFTSLFSDGDFIQIEDTINNSFIIYQIETVASDTKIKLTHSYSLSTVTGIRYASLNESFIINEEIGDGLYQVNLALGLKDSLLNDSVSEIETLQIFYCNAQCCLDTMFLKLHSKMCSTCNFDLYIKDLMTLESLVTAIKYAVCCPKPEYIDNIFKLIGKICNYNNCQC